MDRHAKYGTYQYETDARVPLIEHVNGRRFLTPEQRAAMGWPAEAPKKNFRVKGKGAAIEAVSGQGAGGDEEREGEGYTGVGRSSRDDISAAATTAGNAAANRSSNNHSAGPVVFTVILECGLANRMRTILAFKYVHENTPGSMLKVRWRPSVACPGQFSDVFQPMKGVELIDDEEEKALVYQYYRVQNGPGGDSCGEDGGGTDGGIEAKDAQHANGRNDSRAEANPGAEAVPPLVDGRVVMFKGQATCKKIIRQFYTNAANAGTKQRGGPAATPAEPIGGSGGGGDVDMSTILEELYQTPMLLETLQHQVEAFAAEHHVSARIGLHIRRTDHVRTAKARGKYTDDDMFVRIIEDAVEADPNATFFLATDNRTTQEAILNHPAAKGKVAVFSEIANPDPMPTTTHKTAGKGPGVGSTAAYRHTSIEHGAIDLYLLSRCSVIHGSADSSYSLCAQLLHKSNTTKNKLMDQIAAVGWSQVAALFEAAPIQLRADKQVAGAAVNKSWLAFQHASTALRSDRAFIMLVVTKHGTGVLRYVSAYLLSDRAFLLDAVASSGGLAFEHASEDLRGDRAFALEAIRRGGWALKFAAVQLCADEELVLTAIAKEGGAIQYADQNLRESKVFVLAALRVCQDGLMFQHLDEKFRIDGDIILQAMAQHDGATAVLRHVPAEFLERDEEENEGAFLFEAKKVALLSEIARATQRAATAAATATAVAATATSDSQGAASKSEVAEGEVERLHEVERLGMIEQRKTEIPQLLRKAKPAELRDDAEVVRAAVVGNGAALPYAGDDLQEDREFVLSLVAANNDCWRFASDDLREDDDFIIAVNEVVLQTTQLRRAEAENAALRTELVAKDSETDRRLSEAQTRVATLERLLRNASA